LFQDSTHFTMKMETVRPFTLLVSYHITTWCHDPDDYHIHVSKVKKQWDWGTYGEHKKMVETQNILALATKTWTYLKEIEKSITFYVL
jgi:hypothetical protein